MWATWLENIRRPGWPCGWNREERSRKGLGEGTRADPGRRVTMLTSMFTLYGIVTCRVLSKGIRGLVCFISIALPTELSRFYTGSACESRTTVKRPWQ